MGGSETLVPRRAIRCGYQNFRDWGTMFSPEHLHVAVFGSGAGDLKVTSVLMRFSREQGPGLNSNSRTMSLRMASSYGSFFTQFDFAWYLSLTYATECSEGAARAKFRQYALDLERAAGTLIFWFCVDEIGVFGRFHQHALIGNVQHLSRATWERRWRYGHARILSYDPGRGAAYYVTKHIARPNCEFMISDHIEAFRRIGSELHVVGSNRAWDRGDDPLSGNWHRPEEGDAGLTKRQLGVVLNDVNHLEIAGDCNHASYRESFPQPRPLSGHVEPRKAPMITKQRSNGTALCTPKGLQVLAEEAIQLDGSIRVKAKALRADCAELGGLLARMRDLWRYLPGKRFRSFEEYATAALGESMSRSRVYELITANMLTQGPDGLPPATVARMGIKKASELSRVEPSQRTPELVRTAVEQSLPVFKRAVQAKLNETLPADEQKPMLKLLAINLPEEHVQEFEELIELLGRTDGARDGDTTQAIRAKAFKLMLIGAAEYWAQEIAAVMRDMKAEAAIHDSPAASAEEDFPEEG